MTNIAQLFSGSALNIICRISAGVYVPKDVQGKRIGVWGVGDQEILYELLDQLSIPRNSVEVVMQLANGEDLIDGNVACATAMSYNEYWKILHSGIPSADLVVVDPQKYGTTNIEDGLYVMSDRLQDPIFREQMVRLIRALRKGWSEARIAPTLAAQSVQKIAPHLDPAQQLHMLQVVLDLLPKENKQFGLFNLAYFEKSVRRLSAVSKNSDVDPRSLWTHQIWNQVQKEDGRKLPLTEATRFYVTEIVKSTWFKLLIYLSAFTFALSGTLEGMNRNYDLWGRLVLALLSGLGGGTYETSLLGESA